MRRQLCLLALVVALGLGAGLVMQASREESAAPAPTGEEAGMAVEASDALAVPLDPGTDCAVAGSPVLPEGVEAGDQVACCIDQCRTNADCYFRCGEQPGQCVMINSCCRECACPATSFTSAPQSS